MTESDLKKLSTFNTKNLRRNCEYSGPSPTPSNIFSPATTTTTWAPSSGEGDGDIGVWTFDERRARQPLPHSPSLAIRGEAKTRANQEHLASNCRRGTHDPPSHLGVVQKLAWYREVLSSFVAALHDSPHNGNEYAYMSTEYF